MYGVLAGIAGVLLGMFLGRKFLQCGSAHRERILDRRARGLGSVSGSLIAAFVVGYLETLTAYLVSPAYRTIPALLLLVADLYRPQGLLGEALTMAGFFRSRLFFISLATVIIAATLPLYVSGYILGLLTVAFYFGVFAMAWYLLFSSR